MDDASKKHVIDDNSVSRKEMQGEQPRDEATTSFGPFAGPQMLSSEDPQNRPGSAPDPPLESRPSGRARGMMLELCAGSAMLPRCFHEQGFTVMPRIINRIVFIHWRRFATRH